MRPSAFYMKGVRIAIAGMRDYATGWNGGSSEVLKNGAGWERGDKCESKRGRGCAVTTVPMGGGVHPALMNPHSEGGSIVVRVGS